MPAVRVASPWGEEIDLIARQYLRGTDDFYSGAACFIMTNVN
jgi:hypothetical protein